MEINKTNTNKNVVELRAELVENGTKIENVYVDGKKFCCLGYTNEQDRQAALRAIQAAVDGSNNTYEAMQKLMTNANLTDKQIEPDEQIVVDGKTMFISYADKTIYDTDGNEVVNCKDITCELPAEACKTILMQKVQLLSDEDEWNNF